MPDHIPSFSLGERRVINRGALKGEVVTIAGIVGQNTYLLEYGHGNDCREYDVWTILKCTDHLDSEIVVEPNLAFKWRKMK